MSALPPKADIGSMCQDVRFVPIADSCTAAKTHCALTVPLRARFYDFGVTRVACVALLIRIALSE